jgi:hypothetical protein
MHNVLNWHNVLNYTKFHLGWLQVNAPFTGNARVFQKVVYGCIPNVTEWQALQKRLSFLTHM